MIGGIVFKEIRLARGITIQHLADDYVSKSAILRFERSEADITLEKLIHMLDKMKFPMREFVFLTKTAHGTIPSLELLPQAVMDGDSDSLQKLASDEWNQFKETGRARRYCVQPPICGTVKLESCGDRESFV